MPTIRAVLTNVAITEVATSIEQPAFCLERAALFAVNAIPLLLELGKLFHKSTNSCQQKQTKYIAKQQRKGRCGKGKKQKK